MAQMKWTKALPISFNLYADSGYSGSDQCNKKWVLSKSGMNPPALAVQSDPANSNGMIRIFPGFREGNLQVYDPKEYHQPAKLNDFFINWIEYEFQPLAEIKVISTHWVPEPNIISGIFLVENLSNQHRKLGIDLGCLSISSNTGKRIGTKNIGGLDILTGEVGSWQPVIFLSGSTQFRAGPYPTLSSEVDLIPGSRGILRWVAVLGHNLDDSIRDLVRVNRLDWEGELSRLRIKAQDQLEIDTGDQALNFAISMSQKEGAAYYAGNIVTSREGDNKPQFLTAFLALYLLQVLSPIDPEKAWNILNNAILSEGEEHNHSHLEDRQFSDFLTLPLLGELIWQINLGSDNGHNFEHELAILEHELQRWFSDEYDRDGDGIPELIHPCQLNLADPSPGKPRSVIDLYDNTPYQESPGLAAILINALDRLEKLKFSLGHNDINNVLMGKSNLLRNFIHQSWNRDESSFYNRDRDTHQQLQGAYFIQDSSDNFIVLRKEFTQPSRIGVSIEEKNLAEIKPGFIISLHGKDLSKKYRIENITKGLFYWLGEAGWAFSQTIFSSIDYITVTGIGRDSSLTVFQPSTCRDNISLLLPLWAKLLKKQDAENLILKTLTNPGKFWSSFGIRSYLDPDNGIVQPPWNLLLGQGLLAYDKKKLAVELITRLMNAVSWNLTQSGCFYSAINANTGEGIGAANSLEGLIPIGFLLQTMGVTIIPGQKIVIDGEYPFTWPVRLRFRGIEIHRDQENTRIKVPGEKTIHVGGSDNKVIPLS